MRRVFYCVIHYYREHVLKTIVDNNIKVDVFGDSWKDSLFYGHPNVIWHPDVTVYSAGIGGGDYGSGEDITITGGTVTAAMKPKSWQIKSIRVKLQKRLPLG